MILWIWVQKQDSGLHTELNGDIYRHYLMVVLCLCGVGD